jgi:hypothetical protein
MRFAILFAIEILICAAMCVATLWFWFGWNFYVIVLGTEVHLILTMLGALWLMRRRERRLARFGRLQAPREPEAP